MLGREKGQVSFNVRGEGLAHWENREVQACWMNGTGPSGPD